MTERNYRRVAERKYSRGYDPPVIHYTEETLLNGFPSTVPVGWGFSIGTVGEDGSYRFTVREVTDSRASILLSYMQNGKSISSKVSNVEYGRVCIIGTEAIKFIVKRCPEGANFNIEFPDTLKLSGPKPLIPVK